MKKSYFIFFLFLAGLLCSTGCLWILPDGDVPPNLVGDGNTGNEDTVPLKDAEAAMSGAVVRTLIRNGYSTAAVPVAFHVTSTKPDQTFLKLLQSTGMIRIVKPDTAFLQIRSRQKNGIWELELLKNNGAVIMKKTVKYHSNL